MKIRTALTAAVMVFALGLAGCAGGVDEPATESDHSEHVVDAGAANSADFVFVSLMIPHHEQAVEMADRAGIKKLYLFHHDLDQTDDDIDAKLEMAQTILEERGSSTLCIAPKEGESFTA